MQGSVINKSYTIEARICGHKDKFNQKGLKEHIQGLAMGSKALHCQQMYLGQDKIRPWA